MTVRSIEDIRRDHDDYRRWQVRPKRNPLANPIPASWRDVGLLLTYAEGFEKLREENERLTAEVSAYRRAYEIAREATLQSHSGHWDPTGGSGSGCSECQRARNARAECDEILASASSRRSPEDG